VALARSVIWYVTKLTSIATSRIGSRLYTMHIGSGYKNLGCDIFEMLSVHDTVDREFGDLRGSLGFMLIFRSTYWTGGKAHLIMGGWDW